MSSNSKLITLPKAAQRVGRTRATLLRWSEDGLFPGVVEINGRSFVFERDLDAWLARAALLAAAKPPAPGKAIRRTGPARYQYQRVATYPKPDEMETGERAAWPHHMAITQAQVALAEAQRRTEMAKAAEAAEALRLQGLHHSMHRD